MKASRLTLSTFCQKGEAYSNTCYSSFLSKIHRPTWHFPRAFPNGFIGVTQDTTSHFLQTHISETTPSSHRKDVVDKSFELWTVDFEVLPKQWRRRKIFLNFAGHRHRFFLSHAPHPENESAYVLPTALVSLRNAWHNLPLRSDYANSGWK